MATQYGISGTTAKGIAASVERAVAEGSLAPGVALPPVRRLADGLGVSPGTVATAYKELRQRGIVVTRGRGGTVVASAPAVASRRPPRVPEGLRDLAGGHPDPRLLPALVPPSRLSPGARSHRSAPRLARLEDAVREWLGSDGVPVEQVTFAHGALDLIGRLLSVELRPGDVVAMEDPGYHHLLDLVTASGLRMVPVAVDDEGVRPDALRDALRGGARAVVCSPRAQNPYGGRFSVERRDALLGVLRERPEVLVVENDHASAVADAPLWTLAGGGLSRWVHVRTVSKFLGTDLRWAAAACDPITLARHDGRLLLTSGWVSHLLQETVHGLLVDEGTRALVARARETYAVRRSALVRELGERGIEAHGVSGMNVWVPVRDESAVVNGLRSHGWWVAAGARFRLSSGPGVRITVAELEAADAARLASDFAGVLGESEATYGG
ncbi:aminotransferase class I/II-fold pyridoxal phosphate-dependent enzyme [Streptomyces griseorubiginosus]|uniref:aminotransferase class I/II-fold pyridoxal phosphate-dependent enzyme n=1 Tax=Streptomyces griseorubiginosus TaxID=67304 RepID=UPI002E80A505|nr:aminotransferase class I/II-fold pyridoxal phosphate-dependent enzyme [Streptomyces griseorubiginosus]WUB48552.1 aminotransferase class I/II-fold pyridoxal phosphate-dependent enzyme [Streptomyces griseorubiginosus]WUB57079.1 aminotransferase class I/II-fold pyridoxal phosphate-dependent enzyme [Streptomyces griseorubiginosus]